MSRFHVLVLGGLAAALLAGNPATALAQPSFGPETRIGDFGTVPALAFAPDGTGHMVYRRSTSIFYRHYRDGAWGQEIQVNSGNSQAESEFLDRNQPKITRSPDGTAWIVWGGQIRDVDKNVYMRGFTSTGTIKTVIKNYRYKPELLNPEETAISFDPTTNRLHLYTIYVGDPTKREDGHYDLTVNPDTLAHLSTEEIGPPQKNIYGFTGINRAFAFARLHLVRFYRTKDNGDYENRALILNKLQYAVGALRFFTRDDNIVHFGVVSTQTTTPFHRDVTYLMYDTTNDQNLGEVMIDPDFESQYGLVHPAVTPSGNIFLTWDAKRTNGRTAPAYAYRLAGAAPGANFSAPETFAGYPDNGDAHAPAAWAVGETIHVVWGDKLREGLYTRLVTFGPAAPTPAQTGLGLALLGLAGLLVAGRRRARI